MISAPKMLGRSVKSRITSEICEQFCVEKILLTCRIGKKKQKICKIQINKWLPKCCCCFLLIYFIVATSLTSPCGTKGVICYVLIYLFFEQDENKTQQIEEQNLTKVISEKFSIINFFIASYCIEQKRVNISCQYFSFTECSL